MREGFTGRGRGRQGISPVDTRLVESTRKTWEYLGIAIINLAAAAICMRLWR